MQTAVKQGSKMDTAADSDLAAYAAMVLVPVTLVVAIVVLALPIMAVIGFTLLVGGLGSTVLAAVVHGFQRGYGNDR